MSRLAALRIIPTEKVAGLLLLTGAAFWGLTFPAAKEALEIMGPLAFMTWSRAVGFISLVPLAWGTPRDRWREALPLGLLLGVLLFFAYLFQTLGLERTTATNAGFLTGLYVVGTPLFGAAIYRRWPSVRVLVAVAMSTAGLALLSLRGWSFSPGDSLVMLSVVFWSLQILAVGRGTQRDPVVLILVEMAFATILHAASSGFDLQFDALPRAWPYLIITGVLGTGLAYFVQIIGQRRISPTRTAIIYTGEPVFAAFFSALWLGERLNARGWAGAALIVAAMIVAETGGRDSVAEAAPDPARQGP